MTLIDRCEMTNPMFLALNPSPPLSMDVKQKRGRRAWKATPKREMIPKLKMMRLICFVNKAFTDVTGGASSESDARTESEFLFGVIFRVASVSSRKKKASVPLMRGKKEARSMGRR